jgi:PAS domain-containing protein
MKVGREEIDVVATRDLYTQECLGIAAEEIERLLLRIAANQATIALQEARDHDELEALVAARTQKLARANESLHRSETYLAEAQRLSHTGTWVSNVATRKIVYWSQEHFRIFGFDPKDGMPSFATLLQRIQPDDRARATEIMEKGVRERTDYQQDFRIVLPDGTTRYMHATGHPVLTHPEILWSSWVP